MNDKIILNRVGNQKLIADNSAPSANVAANAAVRSAIEQAFSQLIRFRFINKVQIIFACLSQFSFSRDLAQSPLDDYTLTNGDFATR